MDPDHSGIGDYARYNGQSQPVGEETRRNFGDDHRLAPADNRDADLLRGSAERRKEESRMAGWPDSRMVDEDGRMMDRPEKRHFRDEAPSADDQERGRPRSDDGRWVDRRRGYYGERWGDDGGRGYERGNQRYVQAEDYRPLRRAYENWREERRRDRRKMEEEANARREWLQGEADRREEEEVQRWRRGGGEDGREEEVQWWRRGGEGNEDEDWREKEVERWRGKRGAEETESGAVEFEVRWSIGHRPSNVLYPSVWLSLIVWFVCFFFVLFFCFCFFPLPEVTLFSFC